MKAVVTRVKEASVCVDGVCEGRIGTGLLVLLGVARGDGEKEVKRLADKICSLRIFPDREGKMNRDLKAAGGEILVVSQFTLFADCRRGSRPGFSGAEGADRALPLYERFMELCREHGFAVAHGIFGADMQVSSVNDGPVTILLDTEKL